jgi:DNA topoisomerase III
LIPVEKKIDLEIIDCHFLPLEEQVQKLITTGKTDLLPKFISKKGRLFSAHLKLEKDKVGFEFAERALRAKKATSRRTDGRSGKPEV